MARSSFSASPVRIKVVGLGGGGSNAVTRMVRDGVDGVDFIAMNTDAQSLAITEAPTRIQLGEKLVRRFRRRRRPSLSVIKRPKRCRDEIKEVVNGAEMVFHYRRYGRRHGDRVSLRRGRNCQTAAAH